MSQRLRALLDKLTDNDVTKLASFPAGLAAISAEAPHSIRILSAPSSDPNTEPNCVMYALGLIGKLEDPCTPLGRYYADMRFLRSLIDSGVLHPCSPTSGCLASWSSPGGLKHIGKLVTAYRAASKWGIGYVCEHALLEVPANYGDHISYYAPLKPDDALEHLARFHHWVRP